VPDRTRHWLEIDLIGTDSARDPVGARVTVTTPAGRQVRQYRGGGSYLSTHSRRLHWGLGSEETITRIDINWPNGNHQTVEHPPLNRILAIIEGRSVHVLASHGESSK
jgi:enediyne biosynthesis protein E4